MKIPRILPPAETHDFHDSFLYDLAFSNTLRVLEVTLDVPDGRGNWTLWTVRLTGVLHFQFEIRGNGLETNEEPITIYDVYSLNESQEAKRWNRRIAWLDEGEADPVQHTIFASSFASSWEKEELEGISVISRAVSVEFARLTSAQRPN